MLQQKIKYHVLHLEFKHLLRKSLMNLQENQSPYNGEDIPVCQRESMTCFQMHFPWVKEKNPTISQHFASLDQIYLCCSSVMSTELQRRWIQVIVCEVGSEYMCGRRKMRSSNPYLQKKHEYEFRHILLLKLHHNFATGSLRTNELQMKQSEGVSPSYFLHCCQCYCMTMWPHDFGLGM